MKVKHKQHLEWLDPLYGDLSLGEPVASLHSLPMIQRLRHLRLSNIDSLSAPGISGVSRYEHSLGTSYLASLSSVAKQLSDEERTIFVAAALLHDSAISPFGHLVEEALRYLRADFDHETKWAALLALTEEEPGGIDLQIYCGRESGLRGWAYEYFEEMATDALGRIFKTIKGDGLAGKSIAGDVDLDNLDNVARAGFHMGIPTDRQLPVRIAQSMQLDKSGTLHFLATAKSDLESWLNLREQVYTRFMLPKTDFVGKIMLLSATVSAISDEVLSPQDWRLSDHEYLQLLASSKRTAISEPVRRWLLSDLWHLWGPTWFEGDKPAYEALLNLSKKLTTELRRECFVYGIKDKRTRELAVFFDDGTRSTLGARPTKWLCGIGSPVRKDFTAKEVRFLEAAVSEEFHCPPIGGAGLNTRLPLFGN